MSSSEHDAPDAEAPPGSSAAPNGAAEGAPAPAAGPGPAADSPGEAEGIEPSGEADPSLDDVDVAALLEERDRFRDMAMRNQAELENFRKASMKRQTELLERASQGLVERLLPVLDNFDLARDHDSTDTLDQLWASLWGVLEAEGVRRIDAVDEPFDPNLHEAVQHEEGDGGDGPVVASVMRPGYELKGRVLRAAMVSVRG